jgi:hypothetical protein
MITRPVIVRKARVPPLSGRLGLGFGGDERDIAPLRQSLRVPFQPFPQRHPSFWTLRTVTRCVRGFCSFPFHGNRELTAFVVAERQTVCGDIKREGKAFPHG